MIKEIKLKAWSPSALKAYEECPAKTKYERVQKLCVLCFQGSYTRHNGVITCAKCGRNPPPNGEALDRGTVIHAAIETYIRLQTNKVKGKGQIDNRGQVIWTGFDKKRPVFDFDLKNIKSIITPLRKGFEARKVRTELDLAFTKEWKPCDWMASDVYLRIKMDALEAIEDESEVTDWKTGRFKPEQEFNDQLNIYSVGALTAGFGKQTKSRLVFTDEGQQVATESGQLTIAQLPKAQKEWDKRAKKMLVDKSFVPKPAMHCRWCPYSANKGGPCKW